jgi:serine/threonine protein kinase
MAQPSKTLGQLLDDALMLPIAERLPWVEQLGPEHEAHRARLRAMLKRAVESERLFGTLPKLDTTGDDEVAQFTRSTHAPGARIGAYTLIRKLGAGAMGAVWLARSAVAGSPEVAIKLAHLAAKRSDLRARLERERELLAQLDHPNIARLLDGGITA